MAYFRRNPLLLFWRKQLLNLKAIFMMKNTTLLLSLFIACTFTSHSQSRLFWTPLAQGQIYSTLLDGTDEQLHINFSGGSSGLAIDETNMLVYWTLSAQGRILRTDFSFQTIDTLVTGLDRPEQIAVDPTAGYIYWTDPGLDHISRSDLDGNNITTLFSQTALNPISLYLDAPSGSLYYGSQSGIIGKINTQSLVVDTLLQVDGIPGEIELDPLAGKLYWTLQDLVGAGIQRCDLDGSNVEYVVTDLSIPNGLALDLQEQELYWTDWGGGFPKTHPESKPGWFGSRDHLHTGELFALRPNNCQ